MFALQYPSEFTKGGEVINQLDDYQLLKKDRTLITQLKFTVIIAEQFIHLETTLTNQNLFHEEIKSKMNSGDAFYHLTPIVRLPVCSPKIQILRYTKL